MSAVVRFSPEGCWCDRAAGLAFPPRDVLGGVGVHRLVRATVGSEVSLGVTSNVHAGDGDRPSDGSLEDSGGDLTPAMLDNLGVAHVDEYQLPDHIVSLFSSIEVW